MQRAEVWRCAFGRGARFADEVALPALAAVGVRTVPFEAGGPRGIGIILFDEITDALCDFARSVSRNGLERVLAVGATTRAIAQRGAWRLLRAGASDVFAWDHSPDPAREVAARLERWRAVDALVASPLVSRNLVGESAAWLCTVRQVVEVAAFTDSPVLITGESGTGKEMVARLIHSLDPKRQKRGLVVVDCATIVPELSGSEFFGHERGAFTGATGPREGAFSLADGGTLFLDEVGELPLQLQAQLLRAIQEHTYKRLGGNQWRSVEFRLVCATNRDLLSEVAEGRFRADLYYRLASVVCHVPPLRDRPGDIIPLFRHFFTELGGAAEPPELDGPVREYLLRREYPGNVRDLKQLVARMAYRHVGPGPVTVGDLPEEEWLCGEADGESWRDPAFDTSIRRALLQGVGLKEIGKLVADTAIRIALDDEEGNVQRAAHRLGVTDRALQMRRAADRRDAEEGSNGATAPMRPAVRG